MKLKKIGASFIAGILLVVVCASCVTQTRVNFSTDVDGAEVFVDGEKIGTTPVQKKLSNVVWENPDILIKKEGYKPQLPQKYVLLGAKIRTPDLSDSDVHFPTKIA